MNKDYVRKYWRDLYQRSLLETRSNLGIKGERTKLVIQLVLGSLILGFISAFSTFGFQGAQNVSRIVISTVVGTVVTAITIFIGLAWGARIIALKNIFGVAALNDYEQREQIIRQETFLSPIVDFKLKPFLPRPNADGDRWVGVQIHNKSGNKAIEKCKVKLYGITKISENGEFDDGGELPSYLLWSANESPDSNGFLKISGNGVATINIARSKEHYQAGWFTLSRGDNFLYFPSGKYLIRFRIEGAINNYENGIERPIEIPERYYIAELILDAGKNLWIEDNIKIVGT